MDFARIAFVPSKEICIQFCTMLQEPVQMLLHRLTELLQDWPGNPLLTELVALCRRVLSLPLTCTLKAAMTGLELLVSRAQVKRLYLSSDYFLLHILANVLTQKK